jgi:UDP-N-acetylmuramyl pentapeptide phosphotransferase/UDP-N-acetylglucosamine-1-phosphate transferase
MIPELLLSVFLLFASFTLTWFYKRFSLRKNIIDIPNERSSHTIPTPRGGGLAIIVAWFLGITILFVTSRLESKLYYSLLCGIPLAAVSLIDDIFKLKPWVRLLIMFISSTLAILFIAGSENNSMIAPDGKFRYILLPVFIVGVVWFINLFNFLDGIDGYASIEAILVSIALFIFTNNGLTLILATCVLGFLYWNWPRAKIFMGDVGSTQLGYIIAILGIYFNSTGQFSLHYWIILLSPFWFDATLTLYRRWRNNEKLSQAHRKHIYQRLVQSGLSHLQVDMYLVVVNILMFLVVLVCRDIPVLYLPFLIATLVFLYLIARYADKKKSF